MAEGEFVGVAFGDVAAAEQEPIGLRFKMRQVGLNGCGLEDYPRCGGGLGFLNPLGESRFECLWTAGKLCRERGFELGDAGIALAELFGNLRGGDVVGGLAGVVEQRHHAEIIRVQDGVVLVSVTLGAVEGEPHPRRARDTHPVRHGMEPELERIDAALLVEHGVPVEPGGDEVFGGCVQEHIPGQLFDAELVVGHVGVERLHDPVPVRPDGAGPIFFVTVRVGIACKVQPAACPAFAVGRGGQESVHQAFIGVRGGVLGESVGLSRRGGESREI